MGEVLSFVDFLFRLYFEFEMLILVDVYMLMYICRVEIENGKLGVIGVEDFVVMEVEREWSMDDSVGLLE